MKKAGLVITIILAVIALGIGFAGTTAALYITQPSASSTRTVRFIVNSGDTTNIVAQHLQDDGLIRSALAFRLYARFKHLDTGIEPGVYLLNPAMKMSDIITALQKGKPDEQLAGVPDGLRVTQYAAYFTSLPNFNADAFNGIVKTGILPDGTKLWQKYWFVEDPTKNNKISSALEGYLNPDHYYFDSQADATKVVETMLEAFAAHFCPGPNNSTQYIDTLADCKSHAFTVNNTSIFNAMEQKYYTTNDTQAIYEALTLGSIVQREVYNLSDAQGVANVYYNRYLHIYHGLASDSGNLLQADPTVQYARDTDKPPKTGQPWWTQLDVSPATVSPKNPYNTYTQKGLPPGPIAAPNWTILQAAADPNPKGPTPYFYFLSDSCHYSHYARNNSDFNTLENKYLNGSTTCSKSIDS